MPFVKITVVKGALTSAQRQDMLHKVTEAMVSVEGEAMRQGVQVVLEESVNDGEWSVGGNMLTIAAMDKMKAGQNPWS